MSNQWFRMYAEIANDPKVLVLTEALRWRYVALLCIHCDEKLVNRPDDEVALSLRVTVDEWISTKESFINRGLLNEANEPCGWQKRQYLSDTKDPTAPERQKRYRDKKRNSSVTSRLPDSDTDTESKKKESKSSGGSRFTLTEAPTGWIAFCNVNRPDLIASNVFDQFRDYWVARAGKEARKNDWTATWRNWVRNQKTTTGGFNATKPKSSTERAADAAQRGLEAYERQAGSL